MDSLKQKLSIASSSILKSIRAVEAYSLSKVVKKPNWELVDSYLPLLKSIVGRMRIYFPTTVDIDDIYSVALSGLITSTQNYDEAKGTSFGSYAALRIRGALLDELRRMDWMPRADRSSTKKYRKAVESLEQELKRPVTDQDICEHLSLSVAENAHMKALKRPMVCIPLDAAPNNGEDGDVASLHEIISDATEQDGRDVTESHELIDLLHEQLNKLPAVAKKVLALYYLEGLRLSEIAEVFDLTESRICQIHSEAIQKLRQNLKKVMVT
ncbi:MAG: hypothetical protein A2Y14_02045 [Verrucomicrobia bacterium GWF2_51_19]|nr:MAG: hypothetical protein A2Y14_02045 [Verrucomicrobia bacterium GWF2_51_19]HCJ12050.1 FliA/WhiG family RNA polymerase sigma factor [Opitutae bacterium]